MTTVPISDESFKEEDTSPEYFFTPGGPCFILLLAILRADFSERVTSGVIGDSGGKLAPAPIPPLEESPSLYLF